MYPTIAWSPVYQPAWDQTPEAYVAQGIVAWGRSRRLGRCEDIARQFKAYLGVQHYDPARWYGNGEARAKFFLSVFRRNRTLSLRTFPTMAAALTALQEYYQQAGC